MLGALILPTAHTGGRVLPFLDLVEHLALWAVVEDVVTGDIYESDIDYSDEDEHREHLSRTLMNSSTEFCRDEILQTCTAKINREIFFLETVTDKYDILRD